MLQTAPRPLSELLNESAAQGQPAALDDNFAAQAVERVFVALSRMETLVDSYAPAQREKESRAQEEIQQLQQENANLKSDRQELVQAVRALKSHNDTLSLQIDEISSRLDAALNKVTAILQGE